MTEVNTQVEVVESTEIQKAIAKLGGFVVYEFPSQAIADSIKVTLTEGLLLEQKFVPCGKFDQVKKGFMAFSGEGDNMLLSVKGSTMFQVTTQETKPHAAKVKKECRIAEAKYKLDNGIEKLDSETKGIIKLTVIESLIPETTPNDPVTTLLWLTGNKLIVGVPTYSKAEDFVDVVRFATDSCPVKPIEVVDDVQENLTTLLEKQYCENIVLMDLVHLEHAAAKGIVKFEKTSIYDIEYKKHLQEGCVVSKMQMSNEERCTFTLNKDFECSGVKIAKDVLSSTKDLGALIITVDEINNTVKELVEVFGGEVNEEA